MVDLLRDESAAEVNAPSAAGAPPGVEVALALGVALADEVEVG